MRDGERRYAAAVNEYKPGYTLGEAYLSSRAICELLFHLFRIRICGVLYERLVEKIKELLNLRKSHLQQISGTNQVRTYHYQV